jgi:hypothetical protein
MSASTTILVEIIRITEFTSLRVRNFVPFERAAIILALMSAREKTRSLLFSGISMNSRASA